ncbi:MAG: N-acetylmuramoyl-L-alanine amidase [Rubrobacteraceae bacterium]
MRSKAFVFLVVGLVAVFGLVGSGGSVSAQEGDGTLDDQLTSAASKYGVPKELLSAMGYANTRWEMPPPSTTDYEKGDIDGRGDYGIMALKKNPSQDTLAKASQLTGIPEDKLKTDQAANIEGGAAVLADLQGSNKPSDINGWYDAVSRYGGGALYANQVYQTLKDGAKATVDGKEVTLAPQPNAETRTLYNTQAGADYPRATFYGASSNNYTTARRGAAQINKIVIHVTQGSWSSAISWFRDSRAGVSANYTVRSSDGKIGQSVREKDIAYHAGYWPYNQTSIGIEHEGYISNSSWFTDAMYRSSARLSAYLVRKYGIPIDRQHIVGHYQVPGCSGYGGGAGCHTDPGRYWNWDKYMRLIRAYAGTNKYGQVVDNASNRFRASGAWPRSTYSTRRYGKDYRYARPRRINDPARYRFRIPRKGRYVVSAWWPANSGYNSATRFKVRAASGWKTMFRNQRTNGGRWVRIGIFYMNAQDRTNVLISHYSGRRGYIIADAVRVRKY